jgi:hypothetical protein
MRSSLLDLKSVTVEIQGVDTEKPSSPIALALPTARGIKDERNRTIHAGFLAALPLIILASVSQYPHYIADNMRSPAIATSTNFLITSYLQ